MRPICVDPVWLGSKIAVQGAPIRSDGGKHIDLYNVVLSLRRMATGARAVWPARRPSGRRYGLMRGVGRSQTMWGCVRHVVITQRMRRDADGHRRAKNPEQTPSAHNDSGRSDGRRYSLRLSTAGLRLKNGGGDDGRRGRLIKVSAEP